MEDPQPQENVSGAPEYLNILVANAPLAMAMFDREMRYLVANGLWIEEFHLEEIPIKGASHYEIFPDLHESWKEVYARCLEGHVERCEEDIFQRPDGSRDWVRWEVRPWRRQEGEIGGLIISCEVVTERKRAEQRTQFEKDFTEGLLAGASPVVVVDLDGRIGRSSEGARELSVEKRIEDGVTYFWDAFSDEQDRGEVEQSFRSEIARSGENGTFSFPNSTVTVFTDAVGKRRKITWTNTAQKNDLGEVDRIIQIGFATELESRPEEESVGVELEAAVSENVEGEAGGASEVGGFEEKEKEESAASISDTGASLRDLAEKVRAARGAAAVRKLEKEFETDAEEEEEGLDFLVGQPYAQQDEGVGDGETEEEGEQRDELGIEEADELGEGESASDLVAESIETIENVGAGTVGGFNVGDVHEDEGETEGEFSSGTEMEEEAETNGEVEGEDDEADEADEDDEDDEDEDEAEAVVGGTGVLESMAPRLASSGSEAKILIGQLVELIGKLEGEVERKSASVPAPPPLPKGFAPPPPLPVAPGVLRTGEVEGGTSPEVGGGRFESEVEEEGPSAYEQAAENVPFGLLLLDEELEVVYANPKLEEVLGFGIGDAGVEGWIRQACPDEQYADEVVTEWRNAVWRRQLTKTYTLSNSDAGLREVEFRPNLLDDGRLLLTVSDVTDSRRSEEALRASEAKFRALFQDSGVGIALVDQTGDIFDVNPAMEALLKARRVDLRLQAFADNVYPEDLEVVHGAVADLMEGGARAAEITARLRADGAEPVWTRLNIVVVRDPDGDPMFTAYFAHDITEQRKATAELEESQLQNRALLEATPDLLFLINKQGIVEDYICSLEFPITVGEAVVGADLRKVVPQLRNTLDGQLEEVEKSDTVVKSYFTAGAHKFETRLVRSGEVHRVLVLRDQTEALSRRDQQPMNPSAFEALGEAVLRVTKGGVVTDLNSKAEALFGLSRAEALGEKVTKFYGVDPSDEMWKTVRGVIENDGVWSVERLAFPQRGGTTGECSLEMRPLELDEYGKPVSLIAVHRDLAEKEKEEEEEEEEEATAVQPAGSLPPEVVYQKITNNLQIIYSLLNLQVNTLDDPEARATLMSSQNRVRAISFVHQQLREHDGMQQVDFAGFVSMLAEHLRQIYDAPTERIGVRIGFSEVYLPLEASIPLALAVNELLSNALWHGFGDEARGEVGIDLKMNGSEGRLVVRDSGSGMPEGDFEELKGLGLHIATTLVNQVGGTLGLVPGSDTAFEVRFKI